MVVAYAEAVLAERIILPPLDRPFRPFAGREFPTIREVIYIRSLINIPYGGDLGHLVRIVVRSAAHPQAPWAAGNAGRQSGAALGGGGLLHPVATVAPRRLRRSGSPRLKWACATVAWGGSK